MAELHELTAQEQLFQLRRGEVTPLELVEHYLSRIARIDPSLGAFATLTPDAARARAATLESLVPTAATLWGLPLADKDLWDRAGVRTTYGSRIYADFVPDTTHDLVQVLDDAGAVSLGKTASPEFGMTAYTESFAHGPTRNPWNLALGVGGSSGGAAAAVAAGLLPFAPGSDGGGSIRIPAAATGLVGLKPSRGRVGAGSGFDSLGGIVLAGPIARTVSDAALLLDAMIGTADEWSTRPPTWDGGAYLNAAVRGEGRYQLGVLTSSPWDESHEITLSPDARSALDLATAELDRLGHGLEHLTLAPSPEYPDAFTVLWQAGAATIPVGEPELGVLEPITRWLVERGRALDARRLAEALEYLSGFERSVIRQLAAFDAVLTPALAHTPPPIGWFDAEDAERNFAQQVQFTPWTGFVNVCGLPAITLPVLQTADGLPVGVQLVGRPGGEHVLLAIGAQLERRLRWQDRHPPGW